MAPTQDDPPRDAESAPQRARRRARLPVEIKLLLAFAGLILVGSILLALPVAHAGQRVGVLDALFTATSAVCVTGLIVVDTGTAYSAFGQWVILFLFQLGGLGIMTFAALATQLMGSRLSFQSQAVLNDLLYQRDAARRIRGDIRRVVLLTLALEAIGAALLFNEGLDADNAQSRFSAVFHAVSAFCNAGFSLHADSLTGHRTKPVVVFTVAALIFVGGLGHTVLIEAWRRAIARIRRRPPDTVRWSLNARVATRSSVVLIFLGMALLILFGLPDTDAPWYQRAMNAFFQSVTTRTAGFNTVDIGAVAAPALLVMIGLMFIGGSPGSCAGGVKTTSVVVWFAQLRAELTGQRDAVLAGRRINADMVGRAAVIIGLGAIWNAVGFVVLAATELPRAGVGLEDILFEQVSAFATVGLSTGLTDTLSAPGKIWIILTMYVGRLGPLTAALAVVPKEPGDYRYPEERIMIG